MSYNQPENRIAQKLQRLVMKHPRLMLISRSYLFMGPRSVSDSSFQQSAIAEVVGKDGLEEVEIWRRRIGVSQNTSDYNKRRKLV